VRDSGAAGGAVLVLVVVVVRDSGAAAERPGVVRDSGAAAERPGVVRDSGAAGGAVLVLVVVDRKDRCGGGPQRSLRRSGPGSCGGAVVVVSHACTPVSGTHRFLHRLHRLLLLPPNLPPEGVFPLHFGISDGVFSPGGFTALGPDHFVVFGLFVRRILITVLLVRVHLEIPFVCKRQPEAGTTDRAFAGDVGLLGAFVFGFVERRGLPRWHVNEIFF
jgi:hypothetical protein